VFYFDETGGADGEDAFFLMMLDRLLKCGEKERRFEGAGKYGRNTTERRFVPLLLNLNM